MNSTTQRIESSGSVYSKDFNIQSSSKCWNGRVAETLVKGRSHVPEQHLDRDSNLQCRASSLLDQETDYSALSWLTCLLLTRNTSTLELFTELYRDSGLPLEIFLLYVYFLFKSREITFKLILGVHVHLCDNCTICKFRAMT